MAKARIVYSCQQCGYQAPKWLGRCPDCGNWNTFEEETLHKTPPAQRSGSPGARGAAPVPVTEVSQEDSPRLHLSIGELNRVLGGGLVPGSLVLIGGDPGIGKSTLALQVAATLAGQRRAVLYISGEESLQQTRMRAERISALLPDIWLLAETDLELIVEQVRQRKPDLLVIDSIQSVACPEVASHPGSIAQIRESSSRLLQLAKQNQLPTMVIGHVTKDGMIAGPRALEHIVDTVLYFEGERGHPYRILRAVKNRFGSTNEIGVFEMKEEGLVEVTNPSALFLDQRPVGAPGSVVTACMEGTRPVLVEVQALVGSPTYGTPRRTCTGVDPYRVSLLVAVLEKKAGMQISGTDIFVNAAGGFRLDEPAVDLAVAMAMASSFRGIPVPPRLVIFGEVGLAGEIRSVIQAEARVREAFKLGFDEILLPGNDKRRLDPTKLPNMVGIHSISEALEYLFPH